MYLLVPSQGAPVVINYPEISNIFFGKLSTFALDKHCTLVQKKLENYARTIFIETQLYRNYLLSS